MPDPTKLLPLQFVAAAPFIELSQRARVGVEHGIDGSDEEQDGNLARRARHSIARPSAKMGHRRKAVRVQGNVPPEVGGSATEARGIYPVLVDREPFHGRLDLRVQKRWIVVDACLPLPKAGRLAPEISWAPGREDHHLCVIASAPKWAHDLVHFAAIAMKQDEERPRSLVLCRRHHGHAALAGRVR